MSQHAIEATIAVEDRKFFDHYGFDLKRIAGAIIADIKAMAKVQGASTITQQYARNLFLSYEKTWWRKIQEALYTIQLEANYEKNDILEGYLNTIYYGHGVYGIEAAANFYFGKSARFNRSGSSDARRHSERLELLFAACRYGTSKKAATHCLTFDGRGKIFIRERSRKSSK